MGLSVTSEGYIACGSEDNSVYAYTASLPTPLARHCFSGAEGAADSVRSCNFSRTPNVDAPASCALSLNGHCFLINVLLPYRQPSSSRRSPLTVVSGCCAAGGRGAGGRLAPVCEQRVLEPQGPHPTSRQFPGHPEAARARLSAHKTSPELRKCIGTSERERHQL